jgi:hypothetical protein
MSAFMRLFYKLGGESLDLADIKSTAVKIQTDLGQFLDSGLAYCVVNLPSQRHAQKMLIEPSCRFFFQTTEKEEKGRTVSRARSF